MPSSVLIVHTHPLLGEGLAASLGVLLGVPVTAVRCEDVGDLSRRDHTVIVLECPDAARRYALVESAGSLPVVDISAVVSRGTHLPASAESLSCLARQVSDCLGLKTTA